MVVIALSLIEAITQISLQHLSKNHQEDTFHGGEEIRTLVPRKSDNLISSQARYDRFDTPPRHIIH